MQSNYLRVCILSHEYPPDTGWGGIATFAHHLARGLVEIGHEVEVVSLAKDEARETVEDGVRVNRVTPYLKDNDLGLMWRTLPYSRVMFNWHPALWKKLIERHEAKPFDVIDSPELLGEGILPAMTKIAPLVIRLYTPHSKFIAERFHNASATFDHQFMAMVERIAMIQADAITSPSRDLSEFVSADLNYPLEKIVLIPNPIDAAEFCPDGPRYIETPDSLKVLFVGRLEERKGIGYLVQAIPEIVRTIPKVHFYIVGGDTDTGPNKSSVLAQLRQSLANSGCQSSVTFIKRVPFEDLPSLYRSADVCVVPSLYDNSPYTCLEAMACGKAVVGSSAGGIREYLVDGESGILIEAKSASAIVRAVTNLLTNPGERERLGNNARQRVMDKFQRSAIAGRTAALYGEAIDRFISTKQVPIYSKNRNEVLADLDEMLTSYNLMVHELLWTHSFRYRIATWVHRLKTRPRLFVAESALKSLRIVFPRKPGGANGRSPADWLERQIASKHQEVFEAGKLSTINRAAKR